VFFSPSALLLEKPRSSLDPKGSLVVNVEKMLCTVFLLLCLQWSFREMEEGGTVTRRWEEMDIDILVKIFQSLTVLELTSGIVHVCSAWRLAACDPWLLYVSEDHLTYTAQRCPRLRKTCFTSMERVETVMIKAIDLWKDLESLTMQHSEFPSSCSGNCYNCKEL
ncbi:hypothetical protein D5086_023860, partial [Populus alba]